MNKLEKIMLGIAVTGLAIGIYKFYTHYITSNEAIYKQDNEQEGFWHTAFSSPEFPESSEYHEVIESEDLYKGVCG